MALIDLAYHLTAARRRSWSIRSLKVASQNSRTGALSLYEEARNQVFSITALWQALAIIGAILLGYLLSRYPRKQLLKLADDRDNTNFLFRLYQSLAAVVWPVFAVIFLWFATTAFEQLDLPNDGLRIAASLLNAWIVVRIIVSNMKDGVWSNMLAGLAWIVAALYILRLIDPVSAALDSIGFHNCGRENNAAPCHSERGRGGYCAVDRPDCR